MAKATATLGHVNIELVETRDYLFRRRWFWRTRYVKGRKIGVRSETYNTQRDAERSIRAHRKYLGTCAVLLVPIEGNTAPLGLWTE